MLHRGTFGCQMKFRYLQANQSRSSKGGAEVLRFAQVWQHWTLMAQHQPSTFQVRCAYQGKAVKQYDRPRGKLVRGSADREPQVLKDKPKLDRQQRVDKLYTPAFRFAKAALEKRQRAESAPVFRQEKAGRVFQQDEGPMSGYSSARLMTRDAKFETRSERPIRKQTRQSDKPTASQSSTQTTGSPLDISEEEDDVEELEVEEIGHEAVRVATPQELLERLVNKAESGAYSAQYRLGIKYLRGLDGVEKDEEKALGWFEEAVQNGSLKAIPYLANFYLKGRIVTKAEPTGFELLLEGAERGDALCQSKVAVCYEKAIGTSKNLKKAFDWMEKSALKNHLPAISFLAEYYQRGVGVLPDNWKAFDLMEKAAQSGFALAQSKLAQYYEQGVGCSPDYMQAFIWMKKAADQGQQTAQMLLAEYYRRGFGVDKNEPKAFNLLHQVASSGRIAAAQSELAKYFRHGIGCHANKTKADEWEERANTTQQQQQQLQQRSL